jgi:uncharacterized membrane protein
MKPSALIRGSRGHPSHPPLTGATIGAYVTAGCLGVASAAGIASSRAAVAWWLALVVGLVATAPTAVTGVVDWIGIDPSSVLRRTGTAHLVTMGASTLAFLFALVVGYDGYRRAVVTPTALGLTLIGLGLLTVGGWLGGSMVFGHGMRVAHGIARSVDDD